MRKPYYSNNSYSNGAKGSTVGYRQVAVYQGAHGEGGKTDYFFHCLEDRPVEYENRVASIPSRSDDLNGYQSAQATYSWSPEGYHVLSRTESEYESAGGQYSYDLPAIFRGMSWTINPGEPAVTRTGTMLYYYPIPVKWVRLRQTTTRTYNPADETRYVATMTRYTYDTLNVGHMQVSQTSTRRSDGSTQLTTTTYPADYTGLSSGPLADMRSDAIFQPSLPIETSTRVYGPGQTPADAKVLGGTYTEYTKPTATSRYLPGTISTLDLAQPTGGLVPLGSGLTLPPVGRYQLKERTSYDPTTANLLQTQRAHGSPTTYLWGYQSTLPVAEVKNATAGQVQATLQALGVSASALPTDETALRQVLEQLRRHLPQARITGLTHRPLIGLTSQTDPTGRLVTYEYDALGRLVRTRDEQGRILSQQQYHYAGK